MLELKNIDINQLHELEFIHKLYDESFPHSERRSFDNMIDLYNEVDLFNIQLITKNNNPVGFITSWDLDTFVFGEHFAIDPAARNGGVGGKAMKLFMNSLSKPLILEVELPSTILSERRIGFYQRLGFKLWDSILYQQPAYHEDSNPVPMKLMSYGDVNIEKNLIAIKEKIYRIVYDC